MSRPPAHLVALLLTATACHSCASSTTYQPPQEAQLTRALSPPKRLEPAETLPGPARQILKNRMVSHSRDMGDLMSAIMILDYEPIQTGARRIADDVNLARPITNDATELNSALPEKFFLLQDALRTQARLLSEAAAQKRALDVAKAYGAVSETCVQCHAAYRGQ